MSQRSLVGVDLYDKYYIKCTYLHSALYKDCQIWFSADVKLYNLVYKLTCVNDMRDTCVLAHTCLLKGHFASHCNVEVGIDVYRLDQSRVEARHLTFHSLTSMKIVNTVDLHCHVSTLWKLHCEAQALCIDMT